MNFFFPLPVFESVHVLTVCIMNWCNRKLVISNTFSIYNLCRNYKQVIPVKTSEASVEKSLLRRRKDLYRLQLKYELTKIQIQIRKLTWTSSLFSYDNLPCLIKTNSNKYRHKIDVSQSQCTTGCSWQQKWVTIYTLKMGKICINQPTQEGYTVNQMHHTSSTMRSRIMNYLHVHFYKH